VLVPIEEGEEQLEWKRGIEQFFGSNELKNQASNNVPRQSSEVGSLIKGSED
jgi:hypothetical protein